MSAVLETPIVETPMEAARGPLVNLTPEQRDDYRKTGELPEVPKTETPAVSSEPKAKPAGESETPKQQEIPKAKPKQTAEQRIAQLESTIEKIRSGLPKPAEPVPAKIEATKSEPISARPKPEDLNPDGTPKFSTHEEYVLALADWRYEEREAKRAAEEQTKAQKARLDNKVEEARKRYENLDEVIQPVANEIYQSTKVSPVIKQMVADSECIVDLIFTLGSDKEDFAKFLKMAEEEPGKAIRYIALTESLISQKLKPAEEAPVKPRTNAPRPPAEAGGRAATPPDSLQAALEGSGGKLTPGLRAEFLRRDLAKLKG